MFDGGLTPHAQVKSAAPSRREPESWRADRRRSAAHVAIDHAHLAAGLRVVPPGQTKVDGTDVVFDRMIAILTEVV